MPQTSLIAGLVRKQGSGTGLHSLIVCTYDKDLCYQELIGKARTALHGDFPIFGESEEFQAHASP
jgi:hypothetical protein